MARLIRSTLRVSALLLASAAAAIAACHSPTAPPDEGVPDELKFSIGGFGAGMRFLRLHGDTVVTLNSGSSSKRSAS